MIENFNQLTPDEQAVIETFGELKPTNPKDPIGVRKVSMSVLPMQVVMEAALGMMEGDVKYGRFNYRAAGGRASVYYDALQRHLYEWWELGIEIDQASGIHHITKAITCLMVLRDCMLNGNLEDDRPWSGKKPMEELNVQAEEIISRYENVMNPKRYSIKDMV